MKKFTVWLLSLVCVIAWAAVDPVVMLQTSSARLAAALKQNQVVLKSHPSYVRQLVYQIIIPHVALNLMAQRTVTRAAWQQATPAQRRQFVQAFTTLLIDAYADSLIQYSRQSVQQFLPLRSNSYTQTYAQVDSILQRHDAPPLKIRYYLTRLIGQEWKIYDVDVNDSSLCEGFRVQFSTELQQSNLATLTQQITQQMLSTRRR